MISHLLYLLINVFVKETEHYDSQKLSDVVAGLSSERPKRDAVSLRLFILWRPIEDRTSRIFLTPTVHAVYPN